MASYFFFLPLKIFWKEEETFCFVLFFFRSRCVSNSRAGELSVAVIFPSPAERERERVPGRRCSFQKVCGGFQEEEEEKIPPPPTDCGYHTHTHTRRERECAKTRACCLSKYGSDALASWGVSSCTHNAEQQANFHSCLVDVAVVVVFRSTFLLPLCWQVSLPPCDPMTV